MDAKQIQELNDGRVLRMASASLLPLLRKKSDGARARLIGAFRNSETELIGKVAELAVLQELIGEIERKIIHTATLEERYHGIK